MLSRRPVSGDHAFVGNRSSGNFRPCHPAASILCRRVDQVLCFCGEPLYRYRSGWLGPAGQVIWEMSAKRATRNTARLTTRQFSPSRDREGADTKGRADFQEGT